MTSKKVNAGRKQGNRRKKAPSRTLLVIALLLMPVSLYVILFQWLPDPVAWITNVTNNNERRLQLPTEYETDHLPEPQRPAIAHQKPESSKNVESEPVDSLSEEPLPSATTTLKGEYPSPQSPWIAVIIDDFGPSLKRKLIKEFVNLPFDITLAILPGNIYTRKIGVLAQKADKEVFIHLPLEPLDSVALDERDMVYCKMSSQQIAVILDRAQEELPAAVGVNNHMGSKATADSALMKRIAGELAHRGLMFVDSKTTVRSAAFAAMRSAGVPSLGRDVFLDFSSDRSTIARQLSLAAETARQKGWAVVIGHVRPETLEVLKQEMPRLSGGGIRFVSASRLIEVLNKRISVAAR